MRPNERRPYQVLPLLRHIDGHHRQGYTARMRKVLHVGFSAFLVLPLGVLLAGCGGSALVMKDGTVAPTAPLHLIATISKENSPVVTDVLTEALSQAGYGILSYGRTVSLLRRLGLEPDDALDPQVLTSLKDRRVDAVMTVAVENIEDRRGRTLLDKVNVRVVGTNAGEQFTSLEWTNSWGCAPGSPCDRHNRMSPSEAANEIAQALTRQLGAPGEKATVFMDDLLPARRTNNTSSTSTGAQPSPVSKVDDPGYTTAEHPLDFAIVMGVESYNNLPPAKYAEHDAEAVHRHLLALGFPERNIIMLKGQRGVRSQLTAYLEEWLPKNATANSSVFFYYSGHGATDPSSGDAYLVPWDGDPMFLQSTAYPLKRLYAQLGALKTKKVLIALDSCFSGAGGHSVLVPGARPLVTKIEDMTPTMPITALAASGAEEITGTLDSQGHGMFTYFLLEGLSSGKRTANDLYSYLKPRVEDEARRQNREQTPALLGPDQEIGSQ